MLSTQLLSPLKRLWDLLKTREKMQHVGWRLQGSRVRRMNMNAHSNNLESRLIIRCLNMIEDKESGGPVRV